MADFFSELSRLVRQKWKTVDAAMQEVYATLTSLNPFDLNAPLNINNPNPNLPALTLSQGAGVTATDGNVRFKVSNGDGSGGTLDFPNGIGLRYTPNNAQTPAFPGKKKPAGAGGGIPGKVLSGGGQSYQVALYENGPAAASTKTVTVTQLQLASGSIPAGTWAIVAQTGTTFSMQVPVWL